MGTNYDFVVIGETASVGAEAEALRVCSHCHGTCLEDQWDPDEPPCTVCGGEGELPG